MFTKHGNALRVSLPSGRDLYYHQPRIIAGKYGRPVIAFQGMNSLRAWGKQETYGPKLVENITQATARDLLAHALLNLEKAKYKTVMHVHDEVVVETPTGENHADQIVSLMTRPPQWAEGLPLNADAYTCPYYQKD